MSRGQSDLNGMEGFARVQLACSSCGRPLMSLYVTGPDAPFEQEYRASCPYCGDKSDVVKVRGLVHHCGHSIQKEDDDTDCVALTDVDGFDLTDDGVVVFNVRKSG